MNIIQLAGRLGAVPDVRYTASGEKSINLNLAVKTREKGEDDTIWYHVTFWGTSNDNILPYLEKGTAIIVVGTLKKPKVFKRKSGTSDVSMDVRGEMLMFPPK